MSQVTRSLQSERARQIRSMSDEQLVSMADAALRLATPRAAETQIPEPLSPRQAQCLGLIEDSIRERGYPPTVRELMTGMGTVSCNGINDHLRRLVRKGHILRDENVARGIRLVNTA